METKNMEEECLRFLKDIRQGYKQEYGRYLWNYTRLNTEFYSEIYSQLPIPEKQMTMFIGNVRRLDAHITYPKLETYYRVFPLVFLNDVIMILERWAYVAYLNRNWEKNRQAFEHECQRILKTKELADKFTLGIQLRELQDRCRIVRDFIDINISVQSYASLRLLHSQLKTCFDLSDIDIKNPNVRPFDTTFGNYIREHISTYISDLPKDIFEKLRELYEKVEPKELYKFRSVSEQYNCCLTLEPKIFSNHAEKFLGWKPISYEVA